MMMNDLARFDQRELKLRAPFGCIVAGPSSSGKSTFVSRLIDQAHDLIVPPPRSILYAYGQHSELVNELHRKGGIGLHAGVPSEEILRKQQKPALVIYDDLLYNIEEKQLSALFTRQAHHLNLCVVFVTQDLFEKKLKVARQNSQYLVLTRAPNAALSIRNLGVQLFPRQLPYFLESYQQATRDKVGSYLFIDLSPASQPALRLRTNIFLDKDEEPLTVFLPKSGI